MQLPQYFQTDNTALANALSLCGCQAPKDEQGNPMPQQMIYTADILRRLGYKGMAASEAARLALKERKPGVRVFQFERTELVHQIEKAFSKAHADMESGADIHIDEMEPEHVATVVYAANRLRRKMLSEFRIPTLIAESEATAEKTENGAKAEGTVKYSRI